jgi:polysaccharide pyruvyl transferase WcaK-like protein
MMDLVLEAWTAGLIENARRSPNLGIERWSPGRRLKLLFVGYNGARNTGSDVRVDGMVRQFFHVLGPDQVDISVLTQSRELTAGYFGDAEQVKIKGLFPAFLAKEVPKYDGVIACEGSMFKSKFADSLTVLMVGALGLAAATNKLSLGYGAEAGHMNRIPRWMVQRYCKDTLVITRNQESREILRELGVSTELGTDSAWTFEPHPPEYAKAKLEQAGWRGEPILALCPNNPYWWPVKASMLKAVARKSIGAFSDSHFDSIYFHRTGPKVEQAYERYRNAYVHAAAGLRRHADAFVLLIAMEQVDERVCVQIAEQLGGAPVFSSRNHDMYELVSIARSASFMASSRYHGIVTTMPAQVASVGVTMDERIRNLMRQRGEPHLALECDDPELADKLLSTLVQVVQDAEQVRENIARTVVSQLEMMARMGVDLQAEVVRHYPDFPVQARERWQDYLPPLSARLEALVSRCHI